MLDFYTVKEVAEKASLEINQVLRLGMSGTIIFSILEHEPRNYEEINEYVDEEGQNIRRTRRSETNTFIGNPNPGLQIKYISTEDLINTVTNEKENKKTLVRALFETRELNPKKGKYLLTTPLSINQNDLIIKAEEWVLFENGGGEKLATYLPLKQPEKVTLQWLAKNISISTWIAGIGLVVSIFLSGIYIAETEFYKNIRSKIISSDNP